MFSFSSSNLEKKVNQSIMLELSIELPDTINIGKGHTPIYLIVRNKSANDYQNGQCQFVILVSFTIKFLLSLINF